MPSAYSNPTNINTPNYSQTDFDIPSFDSPFPFQQQRQDQEDIISGYQGAIESQEGMPQMRDRLENQFGIPQMRETFQQGQQALGDVLTQMRATPENVKNTTRESLVTSSQQQQQISGQLQKLGEVANRLGTTVETVGQMLTQSEQNLNTAMQYEVAQQKKELAPWEWRYDFANINQAREFTGWTFSMQQELDILLSNQQTGLTLTRDEKQRAHELSIIEEQYQNTLDKLAKTEGASNEAWSLW